MTQDRLAAQAGISKPYLSNIETGKAKNPPSDGVVVALQKALGFQSEELVKLAHLARTPADVRDEHELLTAQVNKLRSVLKELLSRGGDSQPLVAGLNALACEVQGQEAYKTLSAGLAIPLVNKAGAGYPRRFTDLDFPSGVAEDYVRCLDVHDAQAFAARVVGDDMEPQYRPGDIVVFSPNTPARNGDDCFVRLDGDGGTTFKRFYRDQESTVRLQPLNSKYPAESHPREKITGLWPAVLRIERLR
jgi:phage repressor protein C with HTH and peptisase S24 domain